ncbi:MAG: hypothetical protein R3B55_00970 [Candidatus Paceibacterota bacterium]
MRTFLSKFLLSIFIFVFAVPFSTFAQNDWTPPAGPPLGNNVPAPLNISDIDQIKLGGLRIGADGSAHYLDNDLFATFKNAGFYNDVWVGSSLFGSALNVFGKFKYKPANQDGTLDASAQPQPGFVLTALDTQGNAGWSAPTGGPGGGSSPIRVTKANESIGGNGTYDRVDFSENGGYNFVDVVGTGSTAYVKFNTSLFDDFGLPDGNNNGDTLIWDETCNCWVTGPTNNNGATLPNGLAGQTMWYNGTTNAWEATSQINHDLMQITPSLNWTRTNLNNEVINIKGMQAVYVGDITNGTTQISSPNVKIIGQDAILIGSSGLGTTTATSSAFDFENNIVTFKSPQVKFKGPLGSPEILDAGTGRIPMSLDNDGTFKWNKNLLYESGLNGNVGIGTLTIKNPNPSDIPGASTALAAFVNQGISLLQQDVIAQGNVTIENTGDLFLPGADVPFVTSNTLKPLCLNATTKKVMLCNPTAIGSDPGGGPGFEQVPVEETVRYGAGTGSHNFEVSGPATIVYCAAGGGGGGGARGWDIGNGSDGTGGGGGGGGGKGQCNTEERTVQAGDVLTWNAGYGGQGGGKGYVRFQHPSGTVSEQSWASSGYTGGNTNILLNNQPIGSLALGGVGGYPGGVFDPNFNQIPPGGNGGGIVPNASWHKGQDGRLNGASPSRAGGKGGNGESNVNASATLQTGSLGGAGGTFVDQDQQALYGKDGVSGLASYGGGGGGGGAGKYFIENYPAGQSITKFLYQMGGNGGRGGDGYVEVTSLAYQSTAPTTPTATEIIFNDVGQTVFDPSVLPSNVSSVTIEVWGSGGGGGGTIAPTSGGTNYGGGGGGGAYAVRTNYPMSSSSAPVTITIGARGQLGNNSTSTPSNGGAGGTSSFGTVVSAQGGSGGIKFGGSGGTGAGGAGGSTTTGATQSTPGSVGGQGASNNGGTTATGLAGPNAFGHGGAGGDYGTSTRFKHTAILW